MKWVVNILGVLNFVTLCITVFWFWTWFAVPLGMPSISGIYIAPLIMIPQLILSNSVSVVRNYLDLEEEGFQKLMFVSHGTNLIVNLGVLFLGWVYVGTAL